MACQLVCNEDQKHMNDRTKKYGPVRNTQEEADADVEAHNGCEDIGVMPA